MLLILEGVTKTTRERGQWDGLGITSFEIQRLKEDAKDDVVRNLASRRYLLDVVGGWIPVGKASLLAVFLGPSATQKVIFLVKLRSLRPLPPRF